MRIVGYGVSRSFILDLCCASASTTTPVLLTPHVYVGTVRMTPHGAIHWTTFSIFHGDERWRSEGVQIGGIRSARGTLRRPPSLLSSPNFHQSFILSYPITNTNVHALLCSHLVRALGILGNWFDKDYDVHGPAGPTAFWKVSDDVVEEKKPVSNTFWGFLSEQASENVEDQQDVDEDD